MATRTLGDIRIGRLVEFDEPIFRLDEFFDEATPEAVEPHRHWLEPRALDPVSGKMVMPVLSYLVRTRHHTILIDTCIGCGKSSDSVPEWKDLRNETWLSSLAAAGVRPEAVDYVLCTHLHLDHCGWNTRRVDGRWEPTFPNAKYVISREEYAASEREKGSVFEENVLPIVEAKQAMLVDMDYALDDQVWLEPAPGHTPGHVAVHLASKGARAVMCGDIMHTPLQLAEPGWSPNFDCDRVRSTATRRRFLDTHCETDTLVLTAHLPSPSVGRVVRHAERGFDFSYL
jgi:glyoxylase-like metal-dependent hydrolase (beta-lactamase superfamily II)